MPGMSDKGGCPIGAELRSRKGKGGKLRKVVFQKWHTLMNIWVVVSGESKVCCDAIPQLRRENSLISAQRSRGVQVKKVHVKSSKWSRGEKAGRGSTEEPTHMYTKSTVESAEEGQRDAH